MRVIHVDEMAAEQIAESLEWVASYFESMEQQGLVHADESAGPTPLRRMRYLAAKLRDDLRSVGE